MTQDNMKNHMKININPSEKEQVLQTIRDNPGITTRQIKTLLPHMDPKAIEKHTRRMSGWIIRRDSSGARYNNRWRVI